MNEPSPFQSHRPPEFAPLPLWDFARDLMELQRPMSLADQQRSHRAARHLEETTEGHPHHAAPRHNPHD